MHHHSKRQIGPPRRASERLARRPSWQAAPLPNQGQPENIGRFGIGEKIRCHAPIKPASNSGNGTWGHLSSSVNFWSLVAGWNGRKCYLIALGGKPFGGNPRALTCRTNVRGLHLNACPSFWAVRGRPRQYLRRRGLLTIGRPPRTRAPPGGRSGPTQVLPALPGAGDAPRAKPLPGRCNLSQNRGASRQRHARRKVKRFPYGGTPRHRNNSIAACLLSSWRACRWASRRDSCSLRRGVSLCRQCLRRRRVHRRVRSR